jgi:hypothetical protein
VSNTLAIAAVTATLRDILNLVAQRMPFDPDPDPELNDATCSTKSPDKARASEGANQLNLFLYQTSVHPQLRNMDMPGQTRPGENAPPPLALKLDYVLTAYGKNHDDLLSHRLLGRAMLLLHDRSVLLPADIERSLTGNDLHRQIERVRITPHPLTTEELSKLWAVFQTPYRISATYQASVVMIDSAQRSIAALPVLTRGVESAGGVVPKFPTIERVALSARAQPAARLPHSIPPTPAAGDPVTVLGHDFTGTALRVSLSHRLLADPLELTPGPDSNDRSLAIALPDDQEQIPVGNYALTVIASPSADPAAERASNTVPLAIAPRIISISPSPAARDGEGKVTLTVRTSPKVWPQQRASLLVGSYEFIARARTTKTDQLEFDLSNLPEGTHTYLLRCRVDGVDSLIVNYLVNPPSFAGAPSLVVS